jgi:CzcA family heavy metal efflux pump
MVPFIVAGALKHRRIVVVLAAAFLVYGALAARHAKLEALPDFAPPRVDVQTEAPGLAPEQVERLVTQPIETALGGVADVESLRSESIQGLSIVNVTFAETSDVFRSRQLVGESLAEVGARLPANVRPPRLSPLTSATMDVLKIGLTSRVRTPLELRTIADWTMRPRLLMVPGVVRVNVFGGEVRQLQVQVDPQRARAHGVSLADVAAATRAAAALHAGGFVETAAQRLVLDVGESIHDGADLGATVVTTSAGLPLRVADLATVTEAGAPRFGDAVVQGEPGVLLTLSTAYGANTMEVTRELEAAIEELRPGLERDGVLLYPALHRPASFVESAIGNLERALLVGAVLVVFVLVAFLRDARAAFVSLTAIPLSLLGAVAALRLLGVTLNTMSLGGLAIAIGEVVDDAIVDVDNIVRRLRANRAAASPRPAFAVVLGASLEVRRAVVFATGAVALVFLPLLTLGGLQGRFFAPLALSYLLAIGISLVIALTVTPALALTVLGTRATSAETPWLQAAVQAGYDRTLAWVWRHERLAIGLAGAVVVGAAGLLPFLGGEFLPELREHHLVVHVTAAPGESIASMRELGERLSRRLLALPGFRSIGHQIGRAEQGEDTWGPNRSEMHIELDPGGDDEGATTTLRGVLADTPGVDTEVLTFLGDRIAESISGETAAVVLDVLGDDLDVLDAKAQEIAAVARATRGAVDVRVAAVARAPHVSVALRPEALQGFGLRAGDVLEQVETAFAGAAVGQVHRGPQPVDVVVMLPPADRTDPLRVGSLLIRSPAGAAVTLDRLADVRVVAARETIRHLGARRRQTVTCNVRGRDVSSFVDELRAAIARRVTLPTGTVLTIGGTATARAEAQRDLLVHAAFGVLGILLLLAVAARNAHNLVLLLLDIPIALAGGVAAAALFGSGLSLGALVGFATLFGVTLRHAIMMIAHYQQLVGEEGLSWDSETVIHGARDRLIPILMTVLVTALGLLPVALSSGRAGGEIDGPMATVILGGLVTSALFNLLLLPTLARRHARFA